MQHALFTVPNHTMTFDKFWQRWPDKRAKENARKAWAKALERGVKPETIMAAVEVYRRNKPDWQTWMHAATFLNQHRFEEYEAGPDPDERLRQVMGGGQ